MTDDLLIKEKGFRQMNKELEQKAQDLMKKIDRVINNYDNTCSIYNSKMYTAYSEKEKFEFLENENAVMQKDDLKCIVKRNASLPHIFEQVPSSKPKIEGQTNYENEVSKNGNLASRTVINMLQAKVDMLQNELQTIRTEYKKKCDVYKDLESEHKKLEVKFQNEIGSLKETITKLENTNKHLCNQSQTLNTENSIIKKDLDKLEKQVKTLTQQSSNYSVRLNRSLENNDKLRNTLKCSQIQEKELRSQIKTVQEDKRLTVNNLGKQVSELVQVFKKQMLMIDNLKKQNACLMAIGQLKLTKEDFSRLLEQRLECL